MSNEDKIMEFDIEKYIPYPNYYFMVVGDDVYLYGAMHSTVKYDKGYAEALAKHFGLLPKFLFEMSERMNTDPNRATAHPFWQVRCKRFIPTARDYNEHHLELVDSDGVKFRSDADCENDLIEYLLENHPRWCEIWVRDWGDGEGSISTQLENCFCADDFFDEDTILPGDLNLVAVQEIEEVVSTHLTQQGALDFIKRKQHDYPPLYTWVESAYWSPELRELQDWIKSLTASNKEAG